MFARRVGGEFHFISYISCFLLCLLTRAPHQKQTIPVRLCTAGCFSLLFCSIHTISPVAFVPAQTLNTVLGTHLAHADTFRFDLFSSHEVWGWWEVLSIELQTRYHFLLHDSKPFAATPLHNWRFFHPAALCWKDFWKEFSHPKHNQRPPKVGATWRGVCSLTPAADVSVWSKGYGRKKNIHRR